MKNLFIVTVCMIARSVMAQPEGNPVDSTGMKDLHDSLNYFLGISLGFSLGTADWDTDADMIARGIAEVLEGNPGIDRATCQQLFLNLHQDYLDNKEKEYEAEVLKNLEEGKAFLANNAKKEGVITTQSGLQYKILQQGNGPYPTDSSRVEVYYEGSLIDGTVFDTNFNIGVPRIYKLNRVIPGWTEGIQLMPVGSTYEFYIPPELAYGERGAGPIPENSVLIFRVKLERIRPPM